MRDGVPRSALATPFRKGTVRDVARDMVHIAKEGLRRRGRRDARGYDESHFVEPVELIASSGRTHAEALLSLYHERWAGSVTRFETERL